MEASDIRKRPSQTRSRSGDGRMLKRLSNEPDYFTVSSIMARVAPSMLRQ